MKLPAFQFYPGDWMKDPNLRRCSLAAKGLWIELLCVMFESSPRGVLKWSDDDVCNAFGNADVTRLSLEELLDKGVASRDESGHIICRRMIRDEEDRQQGRTRQSKFRQSRKGNGESNAEVTHPVTAMSHASSSSTSASAEVDKESKPAGAGDEFGEMFWANLQRQNPEVCIGEERLKMLAWYHSKGKKPTAHNAITWMQRAPRTQLPLQAINAAEHVTIQNREQAFEESHNEVQEWIRQQRAQAAAQEAGELFVEDAK